MTASESDYLQVRLIFHTCCRRPMRPDLVSIAFLAASDGRHVYRVQSDCLDAIIDCYCGLISNHLCLSYISSGDACVFYAYLVE